MPDGNQQVATIGNRDLATLPLEQAIEAYAPNFKAALPLHVTTDHFKRMVLTALSINPKLADCDRRSLFNACIKCASDGLLPDGREAVLLDFNTKIKDQQGRERYAKIAQYLPMTAGIRKRMRNSGQVASAEAHVVYANDKFYRTFGDNPRLTHEPPEALDADRGKPVGAYAIIKLINGEIIREVMTAREIERVRAVSKSKDRGPWVDWPDEMWRKTVLKRASKSAPSSADLEALLRRDEEEPELPSADDLPAIPPRPRREDFIEQTNDTAPPDPFRVVNLAGEVTEYAIPEAAAFQFKAALDEAQNQKGETGIAAVWESNGLLIFELRERGHDAVADELTQYADELTQYYAEQAAPQRPQEAATSQPDDDYWSRQDLLIDPPLRPGTAAIDLPMLRDILCELAKTAPSDQHLIGFAKDNRPHHNRLLGLKDEKRKTNGAADVNAAIEGRRAELQRGPP